MKRLLIIMLTVALLTTMLLTPITADVDVNGSAIGGNMGSAVDGNNVWYGDEFARVTAYDSLGNPIGSVDYSNSNVGSGYNHFDNDKSYYRDGGNLELSTNEYSAVQGNGTIPSLINGNESEVKSYFSSEGTVRDIADQLGVSYNDIVSGKVTVGIEPGAYFTYGGQNYAMTATEMAKLEQEQSKAGVTNGSFNSTMGNLTDSASKSMVLEESQMGYNGVVGSGGSVSSTNIINNGYGQWFLNGGGGGSVPSVAPTLEQAMGSDVFNTLAQVLQNLPQFGSLSQLEQQLKQEIPEAIVNLKNVYEYECDTDVISAIWVSSPNEVTPDNPCYITFIANGQEIKSDAVVMPADTSQLVWFKWHTPKAPQTVTVAYTIEGGMTGAGVFNCNVTKREEITPPDTQAHDTYKSVINKLPTPNKFADHPSEGYTIPKTPTEVNSASNSWSIWVAQWVEKLEDCPQCDGSSTCNYTNFNEHRPHLKCKNGQIDMGNWSWKEKTFTATLTATAVLKADDNAPTAYQMGNKKWLMKSGYGVNITLKTSVDVSGDSIGYGAYTQAQTAYTLFPEFNYGLYDRLLEPTKIDATKSWLEFKANPFSQWESRVHFTPLWFPDGKYTIYAVAENAWTPAGELKLSSTDYVEIEGNCYDDWHIAPSGKKS